MGDKLMPMDFLGQLKPTMQQIVELEAMLQALAKANQGQGQGTAPTKVSQVGTTGTGGTGPGSPALAQQYSDEWKADEEAKRQEKLDALQREHELKMKQMELDSAQSTALADAMSKERIAGVGAEAGKEQAKIGAAGQVAASKRTTMEKGYELIDALWNMDKASRDDIISGLEAKRAEKAKLKGDRPMSTISSGGMTIPITGEREEVRDPEDPLTWLEDAYVYNSETGLSEPKPTGAVKNDVEEFYGMVDDMIGGDIAGMAAMLSGEDGIEKLMEKIEVLGTEAGISRETIDSVKEIYRAAAPAMKPPPEEGGGLGGIIQSILNPTGAVETPETEAGAELWTGGAGRGLDTEAPLAKKAQGFPETLEDFLETIITGPFHPAYEKWKDKRTGKTVTKELAPTDEIGEATEQDAITEMGTWDKDKIKEFQTMAKDEGSYKGPINGLHSNELDAAMRKYFKTHKDEWKETK